MKLTNHAKERGNERMGLSLAPFEKMAGKALESGIKHSDTAGGLKRYFDRLYLSHHSANNIRVYGEFVYLFNRDVLITVFNLPNEFKEVVKKLKKQNQYG